MGKVKDGLIAAMDEEGIVMTMTLFNPNNDPVYSIPLSAQVNLGRAR